MISAFMESPKEDNLASAEQLKEKGNGHFAQGRYLEALELYEEAITQVPTVAIYYSNASACCAKLNEYGKAALFAEEALRLEPTLTKAYFRRSVALMGLGQWKQALDDLRRVAKCSQGAPATDVVSKMRECEKELQKIAFAKAIHVDVFELDMKHIGEIEVDDSYQGPRLDDKASISWKFCQNLLEWFKGEKKLHPHFLYRIAHEADLLFRAAPTVVDLQVPKDGILTICGDIHGQFFDLAHLFELNGFPDDKHTYLFNGDLVDRGPHSVEVIIFLFALKSAFPNNLFIARGNHESESINRMHGFYEEVNRKYDDPRMFSIINSVLRALPLAHVIGGQYFVVHGGLPANGNDITIDEIRSIDRMKDPEPASIMSHLLWSDPQDVPGIVPSQRGEGILFGPDVTSEFLKRNGLTKIIRSHVWENEGYREQHDGQCITIFSAPNYTGAISQAAVINLDESLKITYFQYNAAPFQGKTSRPRLGAQFNGLFPH